MEKRDKIIIAGLVIVIIALVAAIFLVGGNNLSIGSDSPEGMIKYDFNSEFTMMVPDNASFLKEWNNTNEFGIGSEYTYYDKDNRFGVMYMDSPMVTHELFDVFINLGNSSENITLERNGDMVMIHNSTADGKIGISLDESNFKERVALQKGHMLIVIAGNDLDFIKSMADTIEVYQ